MPAGVEEPHASESLHIDYANLSHESKTLLIKIAREYKLHNGFGVVYSDANGKTWRGSVFLNVIKANNIDGNTFLIELGLNPRNYTGSMAVLEDFITENVDSLLRGI